MFSGRFSGLCILVLLAHFIRAQDVVYLNNGSKLLTTIREISSKEIKYKNFNNPDGPTYVISKSDVLLIEYKNGTVEVITPNPPKVTPPQFETHLPKKEAKKDPYEIYYLNKNCIYLNGLALANSDISLMYEHEFKQSRFSFILLGAYNFNIQTNYTNRYLYALNYAKKNYDLGAGINYFTQAKRKSQYFVGLWFKYMNYNYVRETVVHDSIAGFATVTIKQENVNSYQFATLFMNGVQVRVTPFFTYRVFLGLGFTNRNSDITFAVREEPGQRAHSFLKAYAGICVGYRFN